VASNLQRIAASITDAPDIDEEKVAAVKRALATGTYKVDPDRIADRLMYLDTVLRRSRLKTRE
jgi:negative regulator of flagellin synthesis FlgM